LLGLFPLLVMMMAVVVAALEAVMLHASNIAKMACQTIHLK
jgi:hypothetical protein